MEHFLRLVDLSSNVWEGLTCVAGVKRGRGGGDLGVRELAGAREGERKGTLLPPPSRAVSRPNSLSLPFRAPATQAREGLSPVLTLCIISLPIKRCSLCFLQSGASTWK